MTQLNAAASVAMVANAASAATDITGFGLVGHAFELAEASGVSLRLVASAVPLMAQTLELAAQGCLTRAHQATIEHVGLRLAANGVDSTLIGVLCDAQTSGGLLISIAPERAAVLLGSIRQSGCARAAEIGAVVARRAAAIELVDRLG
jgi:selenide,water dikinase